MNKKFLIAAALVLIIGGSAAYFNTKSLKGDFSSVSSESSTASTTSETTTTETETETTNPPDKLFITNPSAKGSYKVGQNDFKIAYFGLRNDGTTDVKLTSLLVDLTATGDGLLDASGSANYSDLKIVDSTGATIMTTDGIVSESSSGSDSVQSLTFTGNINLTGTIITKLYITADAANVSTLIADTIKATIPATHIVAEDSSGKPISSTSEISPENGYIGKVNTCR